MPLPDDADLTPEALDTLRELVNEWLKKARKAVWSFQERDGFFIRDSHLKEFRPSLTTSTRSYMALAYGTSSSAKSRRWRGQWMGSHDRMRSNSAKQECASNNALKVRSGSANNNALKTAPALK
jgi:hypothetical protein